jgi:hypothetical protein
MRQDTLARVMTEFSVHQGGETVSQVMFREAPLGIGS